jgi:alanine racemase
MIQANQSEAFKNIEISEDALSVNIQKILSIVQDASKVYFVLKANAYGHGIEPVIRQLLLNHCCKIAVESVKTAIEIRKLYFDGDILILHPVVESDINDCIEYELTLTVNNENQLRTLNDHSLKINRICKIHLKLDVGLHRIGSSEETIQRIAAKSKQFSNLRIEGIYAHPKCKSNFLNEYIQLREIHKELIKNGIPLKFIHYADSSVFLNQPEIAKNGMRIGTLLYGILPPGDQDTNFQNLQFRPVMSIKTRIIQIHRMEKCDTLGYYSDTKIKKDSRIAIIQMGYAKGLDRRSVDANLHVLINGTRAVFCGNIFMNTSYIDISEIPFCQVGDEVVIIGKQEKEEITIYEVAKKLKTIPAEIMVRMGTC